MPRCSVCGYTVEWLRSCKTSHWRLFRDHPEILTGGEFFFADPTTPHYPGWHNFWSRDWTTNDAPEFPALGEQKGTARWDLGSPPEIRVRPGLVGSADCCAYGASYPPPFVDDWHLEGGFDFRCLLPPIGIPILVRPRMCARENLIAACEVLLKLADSSPIIVQVVRNWLGDAANVSVWYPSAGRNPAMVIADLPDYTVVLLGGSDNGEQLFMQALNSIIGPSLVTGYPAIGIWMEAAVACEARLRGVIGTTTTKPIYLIGHSFGGVVATVIGLRMLDGNPDRFVQVTGFGVPKCLGQVQNRRSMARSWCFLANEGDPVPDMPPGLFQLGPVTLVIPFAVKIVWALWFRPGPQFILNQAGELRSDEGTVFYFWQLLDIMQSYLSADPYPIPFQHELFAYFQNLTAL